MSSRCSSRAWLLAGASAACLQIVPVPALAQDAGQAPATSEADQTAADTGDIVVTARRRAERLLDVPVAITAFTGDQLTKSGTIDITDISNVTPNTTFENSRGTNSTLTAFIRGVGQQDPVPGFEAGVGLYLDDVYLNRPQASVLDVYDVERIEVLRGPQGTLYGRNTIGGAIKYVTRKLPDTFELKLRGTYGNYDQADGLISVSAPVAGFLKLGGSFVRLSRGGFGTNLNLGIPNYNKDIYAGRVTAEAQTPDSRLFVRLTGDFTDDRSAPRNGHRLVPGLLSGAPVLTNVFDTRAGLNNPIQNVQSGGGSLSITAQVSPEITFRSISAYREDRSFSPIDFDALPAVDVDVPAVYRNDQTSQEFQFLYKSNRLNGIIGYYYLGAKASTAFDVILGTTGALLRLPGLNAFTAGDVRTDTSSFFGDFTYDVTSWLSLSAGGRYTWDERKSRILRQTRIGGTSPEFGGTATTIATATDFRGRALFRRFTPRGSINFKPSADHLLYASYSEGFKGGGFDPRGGGSSAPDTNRDGVRSQQEIFDFLSFDPETVRTYEIGWKGAVLNRRLTFAVDAFYSDYRDVQIPGSVGVDTNGDGVNDSFIGITSNAGKATLKGVELEANAQLAPNFAGPGSAITANGTFGYIDARYDRFIDAFGNDVARQRRIQNTPAFTASGTLGGRVPVFSGAFDGSTTVSYRSRTTQFETPSPFLDQPGYALVDANLTYSWAAGRYSVGIHGKNLTDKRYITSGYQFLAVNPTTGVPNRTAAGNVVPSLGREGVVTAFYGNPRQVFVTLGVKF